jgi:translation initiation factor 6
LPVGRATFTGSPFLGVHLKVGEKAAVVPPSTPANLLHDIERLFGVVLVKTRIFDTDVVGSFVTFNTQGLVVGSFIGERESAALESVAPVHVIRGRFNALGNNVLANDHGAIVHPDFSDDSVAAIGRALRVPSRRGTVAGLGTVGMAGIATNSGAVPTRRLRRTRLGPSKRPSGCRSTVRRRTLGSRWSAPASSRTPGRS